VESTARLGNADCAIKDAPSSTLHNGNATIPVPPHSGMAIAVGPNVDPPQRTPQILAIVPTDTGNSLPPAIVDDLTSDRTPRKRRPTTRYDPGIYNSHSQPSKRKRNYIKDEKSSNSNQLPVASAANENSKFVNCH
jgi:hypothetical protein